MEIPRINFNNLSPDEFKKKQFSQLINQLKILQQNSYGSINFNPNFLLNLSEENQTALLKALSSIESLIINLISKNQGKKKEKMIFSFQHLDPLSKFSVVNENSQLFLQINRDKHQLPPNSMIIICKQKQNLQQPNSRNNGENLATKDK
ncbi:MAG: hypothetical protein RLZZ361_563 [Cyanobacteriota bacterium]|jgi:hypothetical protein